MTTIRVVLFGLVAGVLLSLMRAPAGLDLIHAPLPGAVTSAAFRAAALLAVGLAVSRRSRLFVSGVPVARLALGVALGYALHGLALGSFWFPETRLAFAVAFLALSAAMVVVAGRPAPEPDAVELHHLDPDPSFVERLGLLLAGAGAALATAALLRPARLLTLGLPQDDTVYGVVFLVVAALLGAAAIAVPLGSSPGWRALLLVGLVLVAPACLYELGKLAELNDPDAYESHLRVWNWGPEGKALDSTWLGTWQADGLFGVRLLAAPALVLGAALGAARHRQRLASALIGAALGTLATPLCLRAWLEPLTADAALIGTGGGLLLGYGAAIASLGGILFVAATTVHVPQLARLIAIAIAGASAAVPWVAERSAVFPISPWDSFLPGVKLLADAPEGLVTVETARDGDLVATLDRMLLTPLADEREADAWRMRASLQLLPPELREPGAARVLLVGQMDPGRAYALRELGFEEVDRTAPWSSTAELIEDALFGAEPRPAGELITPETARARLVVGHYDLVLVPPISGPLPRLRSASHRPESAAEPPVTAGLAAPEKGLAVVWLDAGGTIAQLDLGESVVLATGGLENLSAGLVLGERAEPEECGVLAFPAGERVRRPLSWSWLDTRVLFRRRIQREAFAHRLAVGALGTPLEDAARGLALHYAAQELSSPWETPAQRTEIDPESLAPLRDSLLAEPRSPFLLALWTDLADALVAKRMPDLILEHVEPLARARPGWNAGERAVARAYQEFGMPPEAVDWLGRALASEPYDLSLMAELAAWELRAGNAEAAVGHLRRALELQPGRSDLERALGIALVRAGDASGRPLLEAALERDPEDEEARDHLQPGPLPPLDPNFEIRSELEGHPEDEMHDH